MDCLADCTRSPRPLTSTMLSLCSHGFGLIFICRGAAHLCVLASNCDEPNVVKLIEALCAEHNINLIKVDDKKKLGQWAGLCKLDKEGNARKVVGASCVAVRDWGVSGEAVDILTEHFKSS